MCKCSDRIISLFLVLFQELSMCDCGLLGHSCFMLSTFELWMNVWREREKRKSCSRR